MLPSLPQDILIHILDALDAQYTPAISNRNNDIWHPGRVSTLRNISLASRTLCAFSQPRLFAHIDFDAGGDVQGRAARLLRYFMQQEDDSRDAGSDEISRRRVQSIRSFRLRDGHRASRTRTSRKRWEPDLATPLGRLLVLFLDAPCLQMFEFEGNSWTIADAGAAELVGYQDYIDLMSSKPSLRILALSNACNVPFTVFCKPQGHQQAATGIRTLRISNVSFIGQGQAQGPESGDATPPEISHPIEHLKLGRLSYLYFFHLLQTRPPSIETFSRRSLLCDASSSFPQIKSLSLVLSVVPTLIAALSDFVYGHRETLEHLQLQSFESTPDKSRASALQPTDARVFGFGQMVDKFGRLDTLTITTHILGRSTPWMDSAANLRWGVPLVVDLLGKIMGCLTPKLRQVNLEIFFLGEEMPAQAEDTSVTNATDKAAANPVWQTLDSHFMEMMCTSPAVAVSITLLPFFFVQQGSLVDAEESHGVQRWRNGEAGQAFGLDECLPNLFAKKAVDVRVDPVLNDKDMLTYLRNA